MKSKKLGRLISLFHDQDRNGCIRRVRRPGSRGKNIATAANNPSPAGKMKFWPAP